MTDFLVNKLLNELADAVLKKLQEEFKLVTGVKDEVENLSSKLQMIRRMLQDVQGRKLKEEPVGIWLEKLEDVAYDVDDVLDEWNTEIQKLKLKADEDSNSLSPQLKKKGSKNLRNKVCSFLLSICSCFKEVSVRHDIAQNIKQLNGRMNMVFQEADVFKFVSSDLNSGSEQFKRNITTSIFDESEVCGRVSDKDTIVSQFESSNATNSICIVSIVGTGGIGKTTLAQLVYSENQVNDHFQLRNWICVSDPFDEQRIARAILEGLGENSIKSSELETLLQKIKTSISGNKFLLVLDDVWTEDDTKWKPIWDSLKHGAPGSTILVTTRSERVARMMETNYLHPLNVLDDLECWTILSRIAFSGRFVNDREKLEEIGRKISKKCKGLPLAAKFLGGLLKFKDTEQQWQNVLESEMWELEEATIGLFPHIYLSYNELSPEMKRCFLYCAVFPKDSEIDVQQLIRMWMAQGYLRSSGKAEQLESRGYECFSNLAMRSFFQNLERDSYNEAQISSCKMHDIVHDFAQYLTTGECCIIENLDKAKSLSSGKVRHLTLLNGGDVDLSSWISNVGKLRSFINGNCDIVGPNMFDCLKCARVLTLSEANLREVPRAVRELIHLRYLDLSKNDSLIELPEEICDLYNLETLNISRCGSLSRFPLRIGNLVNLRHLLNHHTYSHKQFSQGLEKLTSLRTLEEFKVGKEYNKFGYLKNLNQLEGILWIQLFEVNEEDFDTAILENKTQIRGLVLSFQDESANYASVIESLQPSPNLKYLALRSYPQSNLPSWIMTLNCLRRLDIMSGNIASLPALGKLPSLEELTLHGLEGLMFLGRELFGITEIPAVQVSFPKLKILELFSLKNLRIWEDIREEDENVVSAIMPRLQKLTVEYCPVLENLPNRLLSSKAENVNFWIVECPKLPNLPGGPWKNVRLRASWCPRLQNLSHHLVRRTQKMSRLCPTSGDKRSNKGFHLAV